MLMGFLVLFNFFFVLFCCIDRPQKREVQSANASPFRLVIADTNNFSFLFYFDKIIFKIVQELPLFFLSKSSLLLQSVYTEVDFFSYFVSAIKKLSKKKVHKKGQGKEN